MSTPAPISVVIPAYNAETFLAEAVKSAQAQTLPVAEIIVVDDGSTNGTAAIAASLGARVISEGHNGLSGARNLGIRKATQPWIALLDADDLWFPEKIEHQWAALQQCPEAKIVCCDFQLFNASGTTLSSFFTKPDTGYQRLRKERISEQVAKIVLTNDFWGVSQFIFPSGVVMEREHLMSVGMFDVDIAYVEDVECFLRVMANSPLAVVETPLMGYRQHALNYSQNRLKTIQAYLAVTERMAAAPDRYPPGALAAWGAQLPMKFAEAGRLELDAGRFREARSFFARSLNGSWSLRTFALWLATWTSPNAFGRLISLKAFLSRSLSRSAS